MPRDTKGYTLIELIVVIVLLGMIFTLTAPKFRDAILTDNLKSTTRKLVGKIKALRNKTIQNHEAQILRFDLESNMYWVESADMTEEGRAFARKENAAYFPSGIRIADIWIKGMGKKMTGETAILFTKKGYVQESVIHLESEDGREFTLILSTFLPRVKVLDSYIEFEDL